MVALVRTLNIEAEVLSLDVGESLKFDVDVVQVKTGNLLVEDLGEDVDLLLELATLGELDILLGESLIVVLEEHDLSEHLVGEAARHDERAVASGAAQIDETALSQKDDVAAVLHEETVNLGLDVLDRLGVGLEPGNVNLNVKVTDV